MVTKKAVIEWIPKEQGGSPSYATELRFVDGERWPVSEAWSLVIAKNEPLSTEFRWIADVHFLVDEAPHDSLYEGRAFDLYEGNRCVAHGRILAA